MELDQMMYVGKHPNIIELIGVCSMKGSTQKKKTMDCFPSKLYIRMLGSPQLILIYPVIYIILIYPVFVFVFLTNIKANNCGENSKT